MNVTDLLMKLPFMQSAVNTFAAKEVNQLMRAVDFPPRDPSREWREQEFRTENKTDYLKLYEKHIWYYASVYAVASSLAQIPLRLYLLDRKGQKHGEVLDGAFYNLINRPNPYQTYYDFIEELVSFLELTGDTYIEKNDICNPSQLYILRPDFVEVKSSEKKLVVQYIYKPDGVPQTYFSPDQVIHIKYFHPRSEVYGFSFPQASINSAILDFEAIKFQKKFFKQGGAIDKYITIKKELTTTEYKRFKEEILAQYTGNENSHKPMILDSDGELKSIGVQYDKMLLKEQRDLNRDEIFSGAGVPPIMANILAGKETYNNALTQEKAFWQNTVIPKARKIESKLNVELFWPMGFEVTFDFSQVTALQEDSLKKAQTAQTLVQGGILTPDEVRADLYNKDSLPEGYTAPMAAQATAFNMSMQPVTKSLKGFNNNVSFIIKTFSAAKRAIELQRQQNEDLIFDELKPVFKKLAETIIKNIPIKKSVSSQLAGSLDANNIDLMNTLVKVNSKAQAKTLDAFFTRTKGRKPRENEVKSFEAATKKNIESWAKNSTDSIIKTMSDKIETFANDALASKMSIEDMTQNVREIFEGTDREEYPWARAIARTESGMATNSANVESMKTAGFTGKTWIAGGGTNGREDHTAMDGMTIGIDEYFVLPNGTKMFYPGDPDAGPDELVNCRCAIIEGEL